MAAYREELKEKRCCVENICAGLHRLGISQGLIFYDGKLDKLYIRLLDPRREGGVMGKTVSNALARNRYYIRQTKPNSIHRYSDFGYEVAKKNSILN